MNENKKCPHYDSYNEICQGCPGGLNIDEEPKDWCPYCNGDGLVAIPSEDSMDWRVVAVCPRHAKKFEEAVREYVRDHKDTEAAKARAALKMGRWHLVFENNWLDLAMERGWDFCKVKHWHRWLSKWKNKR